MLIYSFFCFLHFYFCTVSLNIKKNIMPLIVRLITLFILFSLAITVKPVCAVQKGAVEITPLIGYRFGGDFETKEADITTTLQLTEELAYGLLLAWDVDRKRQGEFLISHNNTKFTPLNFSPFKNGITNNNNLAVTYIHIGGNVPISKGVVPLFVTGGFGLTHLSPEDTLLDNETRFSMNLGLATKIAITKNVNFRFGGRVYATFFNSDSRIFCNKEICAMSIYSDLWIQSEVNAGITFVF